jgi:hypothetical protein
MLKIDKDKYAHKGFMGDLLPLLFSIPMPFSIRRSSSGKGLHIRAPRLGDRHYLRDIYDDPMRVKLDDERAFEGMPLHNLFWDEKNGRKAGAWHCIRSQRALLDFLNEFANDKI